MPNLKYCCLLVSLIGACAIPDVEIVDSPEDGGGGSAMSHAGTKSTTGHAGTDATETDAGAAGEPASLGGTSGTAGEAAGGSGGPRPSGGSGGTGVPPTGAVAKFCNGITFEGRAIDLELRIGSGAKTVSIVATTGTCQPVVDDACTPIPIGNGVPVNVYDASNNPGWIDTANIAAGDAWIFAFYFDENSQTVALTGKKDFTAAQCAAIDFSDVFPGAT